MSGASRTAASEHARAIVEERLPRARGLGSALAELIDDPEQFVAVAREGLSGLADDANRIELARVAPGSASAFGVRSPLLAALVRQLRASLAESSAASALWLAQRLIEEEERELILLAQEALRRALVEDPERAWQLIRRLGRTASDWIAVDSLAELVARGIILEPFRWAEVEQLVYSDHPWERRLVGSTIATIPHQLPRPQRSRLARDGTTALMLIESLLGDDRAEVQKALAWALRAWHEVDPSAVEALIRSNATQAARTGDGHRAWVLRDALTAPGIPAPLAAEVRRQLAGLRRRADQPSSSRAHLIAHEFVGVGRLADRAVAEQGERQLRVGAPR